MSDKKRKVRQRLVASLPTDETNAAFFDCEAAALQLYIKVLTSLTVDTAAARTLLSAFNLFGCQFFL